MQTEKEREISFLKSRLQYLPEPTIFYEIGEEVFCGHLKECRIEDIYAGGKAYGITGKREKSPIYLIEDWMNLSKKGERKSHLAKNQDIRLNFNSSTVESLLHRAYHFGINLDPDYQRGYVWEKEDREKFMESVFSNIDIGKFIFRETKGSQLYEIVDGKQRLTTLKDFYENRFSYQGYRYCDLSGADKNVFLSHRLQFADIQCSRKEILKIFLMVNTTGRPMEKEQIEKIKKMLKEE